MVGSSDDSSVFSLPDARVSFPARDRIPTLALGPHNRVPGLTRAKRRLRDRGVRWQVSWCPFVFPGSDSLWIIVEDQCGRYLPTASPSWILFACKVPSATLAHFLTSATGGLVQLRHWLKTNVIGRSWQIPPKVIQGDLEKENGFVGYFYRDTVD
jgi:hypothetical protein